ncbi:hypothetical protein [Glutamicibacter protophormiae]
MTKKSKNTFVRVVASAKPLAPVGRLTEAKLPYVETPTRLGIVSAPYSEAARERDLAWLIASKSK